MLPFFLCVLSEGQWELHVLVYFFYYFFTSFYSLVEEIHKEISFLRTDANYIIKNLTKSACDACCGSMLSCFIQLLLQLILWDTVSHQTRRLEDLTWISTSPALGLQAHSPHLTCLYGVRDLSSGSHACIGKHFTEWITFAHILMTMKITETPYNWL